MLVEILSRIQFGISIGFHILFPTLNLGLALFLVIMEAMWLTTKKPVYLSICKFWTKIFALTFGMGVVSGIVLAYQIGTNFGPFISKFGSVLGALFAYETITAFFLEAGFLGVMLFAFYGYLIGHLRNHGISLLDYVSQFMDANPLGLRADCWKIHCI